MKNFVAAVAAAIRAMTSKMVTWIKVGGEWVLRTIDIGGAPAMPVEEPAPAMSATPADNLAPLKRVAGSLASGEVPTPEQAKGLSDKEAQWLQVLDTRMLSIVAVADRAQLQAHLSGRAPIKGMVPYSVEAVRDMKRAKQAARPQRKTLRDRLAELEAQGVHPGV